MGTGLFDHSRVLVGVSANRLMVSGLRIVNARGTERSWQYGSRTLSAGGKASLTDPAAILVGYHQKTGVHQFVDSGEAARPGPHQAEVGIGGEGSRVGDVLVGCRGPVSAGPRGIQHLVAE